MSSTPILHKDSPPESWLGVASGLTIFLIAGLMLILNEIPLAAQPASWAWTLRILSLWGLILVPAVGLTIGWIKGFPRWTYPYVPLAVFFSLYIANASTPGLTFFRLSNVRTPAVGTACIYPVIAWGTDRLAGDTILQTAQAIFYPDWRGLDPGKFCAERHVTVGDLHRL